MRDALTTMALCLFLLPGTAFGAVLDFAELRSGIYDGPTLSLSDATLSVADDQRLRVGVEDPFAQNTGPTGGVPFSAPRAVAIAAAP